MKLFLATIIPAALLAINIIITPTTQANYSNQKLQIIAKPNCPTHCGKVSIPFPFGIGSDCSSNKWFEIVCENTSSGSHSMRPFLRRMKGLEVLKISVDDSTLQTKKPINFFDCPDKQSPNSTHNPGPINLTGSPFSYSDSRNRFTAVGCNVFAFIDSSPDKVTVRSAGCTSVCSTANNTSSSTDQKDNNNFNGCQGTNCCQTIIPSYLKNYEIHFDQTNETKRCRYAFVVDQAWFEGRSKDFVVVGDMDDFVPVILNWDLFDNNNNNNTTSDPNVHCYPTDATSSVNKLGFQCRCRDGYQGNPYVSQGCQGT